MRQATKLEIKHYIDYRSKHVALVQRLGKLAFNDDFSTHDHDKLELDGETLSKFALWFAYVSGEYEPIAKDLRILKSLNAKHYTTQKHHPEYWDVDITLFTITDNTVVKATRMSKKAMREMVCDWTACSLYHNQPIFKFYNKMCTGDNPKFVFTVNQKNYIVDCLTKLQKIVRDEKITWAGKDYDAEQVEPIRESLNSYEEIIHSDSFKAWFGDWENDPEHSSKVVDANGKPLVVYHGARTFEEFNTFSNKLNFFTDNIKVAEMFAKEYAYKLVVDGEEYYLDKTDADHLAYEIEPYYYEDILAQFDNGIDDLLEDEYITVDKFNELLDQGFIQCGLRPQEEYDSIGIYPNPNKIFCVFLNIRNPQVIDYKGEMWIAGDDQKLAPKGNHDGSIIKNIVEGGYDAEIDGKDVPPATDYIVLNSCQIKSIDNNGNFSTESNNIYEAVRLHADDKDQLQKFCALVADPDYSLKYHDMHESYFQGGYNWQKGMSNRAVGAYIEGRMPISHWRNNNALNSAIENESGCEDQEAIDILTSLPIEAKLNLLTDNGREYHHTGKFYRTTYFYEMNDLSNVTAKDAEKFKQEWEEYSKEKREYNKFVKTTVDEAKGIVEDKNGVKQITRTNAFDGVKLPKEIVFFIHNDLEYSMSGGAYIYGAKPTSSQHLDNTIPEGTRKLYCKGNTLILGSYNPKTMSYDTKSSVELKTNIDYTDIKKLKAGKYEGTKKSTYLKLKPKWTGVLKGTLTEVLKDKPKYTYVIMSSDGRFIHNTETPDLETAKRYRAELSSQDQVIWYTIKKIPLKECETSGAVSGGNSINASSSFTAQAPENVIKMFIPQGDDVLKDVKLKEFKEEALAELKESIIDIPQKEYCKGVLTEEGKLDPTLRRQIIQTIYDWTQVIDFDFSVYKIVAKGSLLTKRYNDTTDLDITVYTDLTKEQLDTVYNLIPRGENVKVDSEETSHAIDIYILTGNEKLNMNDIDNCYDVAKDEWIKRSDEYDAEIPLNYALEVANFFINGCTIALSNYHNDKIMYEYYNSLDTSTQEITEKEKTKALAEVKSSLQADLDGMRLALYMISSFRHDVYGEDANPFHISIDITSENPHNSLNEVMAKLIEKFNIKDELRNCVKECEELIGAENINESVENKTVAFTFGRMNVPTIGHLLLLTKIASITADAHYVYTSHSQDKKKNPLDYATKASLIQTTIRENNLPIEFVNTDARTIIDVAVDLYEKGFKNIIFVGGADTAEEISSLIKKYNDVPDKNGRSYHFDNIGYEVAGIRNPDSDDVEGVSATKVRQFAIDGDFDNFSKYLAVKDKHIAKDVFEEVRKVMA